MKFDGKGNGRVATRNLTLLFFFAVMAENDAGTQGGEQMSQRQDGNQPPPFNPEQVQWIDQLISGLSEARRGGDQDENSLDARDTAASLSTVVSQGGE